MASIGFQFNADAVKPQDDFTPIPAGDYIAQITESEIKPTKSGSGQMLTLRWQILDGQFKGRLVFDRINIINQNPKAQEIGQQQLSSICRAAGVMALQDSVQLHNKPCHINVKIRKDAEYGDSNEVKSYKPATGVAPAATPFAGSFTAPAQTPAAAPSAPWMKTA